MGKPCYTCKDKFIRDKRQYLLDKTKSDATDIAKQNHFTGFIAIVQRNNGTGFIAVEKEKVTAGASIIEYLHFDNGTAF